MRKVALIAATTGALVGCQREAAVAPAPAPAPAQTTAGTDEMSWARTALTRNPQLEIIATDAQTRVFTVRDKRSGEVSVVKLGELAAAPVATLVATPPPEAPEPPAAAAPAVPPAQAAPPAPSAPMAAREPAAGTAQGEGGYTIERADGQVRVSGPGVSIVSSGTAAAQPGVAEAAQRATDPIICQGRRMLHLDGRDIYVDGDAITATDGCEVHITNSRIAASGTAVVVHNAVVHVSNSHIEGARNSFDADRRAKLFIRGSTLQGLPRRDELAMVPDQGGNRWR